MKQCLTCKTISKLLVLCIAWVSGFGSFSNAQTFSNWLLDDTVMSFTTSPPHFNSPGKKVNKSLSLWRSCISNCEGNILLYANAPFIFNQYGDSISDCLRNPVPSNYVAATNIFVPKPSNDSIFYIFYLVPSYSGQVGELRYAEINALANNGAGKVIKANIVLDDTCDNMNMCIVKSNDYQDYWVLVTHDSYTMHCYKVDQNGVSIKPVINKNVYNYTRYELFKFYPPPNPLPNSFISNFNISKIIASNQGNKIVCTSIPEVVNNYAGNAFMYDFDLSTGKISNGKSIMPVSALSTNYSTLAACFSGDDSLVYLSILPSYNVPFSGIKNYKVVQFNIKNGIRKTIRNTTNSADALATMALGNDGRIYGFSGTNYDLSTFGTVSIIEYPNKLGNLCHVQRPSFFPHMYKVVPSPTDNLINIRTNLDYSTCVDTVLFSVQGDTSFSKLTCLFGDGDSMVINSPQSKIYSFKHYYKTEGRFANVWEGRTKDCNAAVWYTDTLDVKFAPKSISKNISFVQSSTCTNASIQFKDTVVHATVYQVNWGDDSIKAQSATGGVLSLGHTYLKPGNYTITVTVSNVWSCSKDYMFPVKIDFLPTPKIGLSFNKEQCANRLLRLVNDSALDMDTLQCVYNKTQTLVIGKNPVNIPLQFGQDSIWAYAQNPFGCVAKDTLIINVKQGVNAAFYTSKNNYCVLETDTAKRLYVNANDSSVWYWENAVYPFAKDFLLKATQVGTQTLVHSMENSYGCKDTQSAVLEIHPLPDARFTSLQAKYCTGETIYLALPGAFPSDTVRWYINGVFQQQGNKLVQILSDTGKTNYKTIAISQYGCKNSAIQATMINKTPSSLFSISDTTICQGDSIILSDLSNADSSRWHLDDMDMTSKTWRLNFGAQEGKYSVMHIAANLTGCRDTGWGSIGVQNYPKADFSFTNACQGQKVDFTDKSTGTVIDHHWVVQGKKYSNSSISDTFKTDGLYPIFLRVNTSFGCTDSITRQMRVYPNPRPTIYFMGTSYVDPYQFHYYLEARPDSFSKYNWTLGSAGSSDKANVYATFNIPENEEPIHLEVLDKRNCIGYADTVIKVLGLTGYFFPNSFTPNNDRINDGFGIAGPEYVKTYKLRIFNRWGEEVFYTENPYHSWNPENPVPGEYIYKAVVQDIYSRWKEIKGIVILIK